MNPVVTLGLIGTLVVVALGLAFAVLGRIWTMEVAFVRVSWIPAVALALEVALFGQLTATFSYLAVAFPVITCFLSLLLGLIGITLLTSASRRGERHPRLPAATILASTPGGILIAYVLFAFLVSEFG